MPQVVDATLAEKIKEIEFEPLPSYQVRNWFETKREGAVMLKVTVTNKQKSKVKVAVGLEAIDGEGPLNVKLPKSLFKDKFVDNDTKCFMHL